LLYGLGMSSAGARFRAAVKDERPSQVVGCIYAYAARMAERVGFKAIYLSGGGVAAGSLGLPDLGITTLDDVLCRGRSGGGAGVGCRERRFRQLGLYTAYALFEALSVTDMVGPSRRAPVHAEAMHFYREHGWLP
jgi:hypothetical protein